MKEYNDIPLSAYRDKWLAIGLSTEAINEEAAIAALQAAYRMVGLEPPVKYEVYDSPFEAIVEMKIRHDVTVSYNDFISGSHDSFWLSYYDCLNEKYGIADCKKLEPLIESAKHMGWGLLYDELIVLTRKPIHIKMDEDNRTHCEDDLAIKYADGTGVAIWHGVAIPSEWIYDNGTITPEVITTWSNIEQRRCACEILGWATVIKLLEAVVINKDVDETIGTLLEVTLPDIGKEKFLLVKDPNVDKLVGLPVPPEMETALEANSWTYGIDKLDFKPEFRV